MELTPEQITELQEKAKKADELEQRLAALDDNNGEILGEKKKLKQELQELRDREEARKKKELEEQNKTAELLEMERKEKEELRKEKEKLEQEKVELEKKRVEDRVRSDFLAIFSASEVFQPDHAWGLLHSLVEDDNGKTVVTHKGSKIGLTELREALRKDVQYAYLFKPKQAAGGMGSRPGAGNPVDTSGNPYLPGGSVTQRIQLEVEDPDLAAKLKAEASAARAKG
jgi:predicted RNase H-like nuclease (RuvC/YqgF family)